MDWSGQGILIGIRAYGEASVLASVLTPDRGRWNGLVKGARGRRGGAVWQPGNLLDLTWRARLEEQLGHLTGEVLVEYAARHLADPGRLGGLAAACALVEATLPEREAHPAAFAGLLDLLDGLARPDWPQRYVGWELAMLAELGFGLDLASCAATGRTDDLVYVSPKSGRAVSAEAGAPYADRLLRLPAFLIRPAAVPERQELMDGFALTGYFLRLHVFPERDLPPPRTRLLERLRRTATISGRGIDP
jgi:DNA repair protein RecO (recombination protein O)